MEKLPLDQQPVLLKTVDLRTLETLERVADALERIADSLDGTPKPLTDSEEGEVLAEAGEPNLGEQLLIQYNKGFMSQLEEDPNNEEYS